MPWNRWGDQRKTLKSEFSPSTQLWSLAAISFPNEPSCWPLVDYFSSTYLYMWRVTVDAGLDHLAEKVSFESLYSECMAPGLSAYCNLQKETRFQTTLREYKYSNTMRAENPYTLLIILYRLICSPLLFIHVSVNSLEIIPYSKLYFNSTFCWLYYLLGAI